MANVATMGPPPSPKEPRRSGRRTAPSASTSKSPAGSPASDSGPKPKETSHRPSLSSSSSSSKSKRNKQEENDEPLEEIHKNGTDGSGNSRSKRKPKEKEKGVSVVEILGSEEVLQSDALGGDAAGEPEEEDEEAGITRCICGGTDEESGGEFMAMCELCKTWQHGQCMGYSDIHHIPQHYYCEQCRPDLYTELLKKHAKRTRQSSTTSHHTITAAGNASRSSRSRSPAHQPKPTKRRNTMNSRDAAYEESFQALIEATAAEAAAHEAASTTPTNGTNGDTNGRVEAEQEAEVAPNSRKKRKRSDDDAVATKRTRSASTASDRPIVANPRDATPLNGNVKPTPAPPSTTKSTMARNRRTAVRKSQVQELTLVEGDEAGSTASGRRPASNSRSKANTGNDHGSRRAQASTASGHGTTANSHASASAASRAYHNSHAYAVSQQPLFTSWNLPDYLAHLEPMLPTEVPRPLEVRGSGIDSCGRESLELTTERGVKVKWPSKRMSVGDMNKRVRALVEWVGREQASAMERSRRKEAVEKALRDAQELGSEAIMGEEGNTSGDVGTMTLDGTSTTESPVQEKRSVLNGFSAVSSNPGPSTMKLMEELMEELINFQERFGPGAKTKDRERRVGIS
ncbi:hypothetical protein AcV5_006754 [Taiwanofungus camphoratus]|nr:hypothetical protein AcV5_006754 [Antrodia cinnamomea]